MPSEPNEPEASQDARRAERNRIERRKWNEARRIYEQTLEMVEAIWGDRLDASQQAQQLLCEEMRDRCIFDNKHGTVLVHTGEIPVPLFTPRDRVQFLKEATTAFLIFGEKRGLQALPKEAPAEQPEAASGAGEEAGEVALAEGTE